jgi:tRNA pseudouridine32 synthase/23S rRNA pseudouridine746 synthase
MSLPPYIVPHSQEKTRILYEDDDLLLVCKPHLLLTVPGRHPLNKDCMITRLQADYPTASVVHRLDLDTSGILIVPLNKPAHSHISRQFQERQVEKQYDAVVWGEIKPDSGEIDLPIAADWENRPRQMISHDRGKSALTRYEVQQREADRTRVLLKPVTGRSHQLRIHMRELGHPILGCDMYAHDEALAMSPRLLLHASWIGFTHPVTGKRIEGICPAEF